VIEMVGRLVDRLRPRRLHEVEGTVAASHPVCLAPERFVWLLRLREHGGAFWVDPAAGEPHGRTGTRVRVTYRCDRRRPLRRHALQVEPARR
jgi:hypothetical protein